MAKGNWLLGYARGAVGDVVFSRSNGQQTARARNRNPRNPNTEGQVLQRSKFAAAQRFFQLCNSKFFKFAYQDKTARESDYNAFMRHNVGIAPYILKEMTQRTDYPAFAPWLVTQGSLPSIISSSPSWVSGEVAWIVSNPFGVELSNYSTIAQLSSALIDTGSWREGDIFTILQQTSRFGQYPVPVTSGSSDVPNYTSESVVRQFILDTTDLRLISDVVPGLSSVDYTVHNADNAAFDDEHGAIAVAFIHSRNTSDGLQVSTQSMLLNTDQNGGTTEGAQGSYIWTRSDLYTARILTSWQASARAVLQGAGASVYVPARVTAIMQGANTYTTFPHTFSIETSTPYNYNLGTSYSVGVNDNLESIKAGWTFTGGISLATSPWEVISDQRLNVNFRITSAGSALFNGVEVIKWA